MILDLESLCLRIPKGPHLLLRILPLHRALQTTKTGVSKSQKHLMRLLPVYLSRASYVSGCKQISGIVPAGSKLTLHFQIDAAKPSRMHVYADLKPYICTFEACPDMLSVFPSKKLWADHETTNHFSDFFYECRDCERNFQEEAHFRIHLAKSHYVSDLNHAQSLAIISAAKSSKIRAFTGQFCPLCKQTGWQTQRVYFTHLGKHLEQIALSALPPDPDSDSESELSQADTASYRDNSGNTDKEERVTIKCICGSEEDDGDTIRCQICQIFQHIACFYPEKVPVPENHRCYDCSPRQLNAEAPRRPYQRPQLDVFGRTPLAIAYADNDITGVTALKQEASSLNLPDIESNTPLKFAQRSGPAHVNPPHNVDSNYYNNLPPPSSSSFALIKPLPSNFTPLNPPALSSSNIPVQANAEPMPGSLRRRSGFSCPFAKWDPVKYGGENGCANYSRSLETVIRVCSASCFNT
jgi:hypothetical protein